MSITTYETTIRQWVKNHTKDDIAIFVEDQIAKRDKEIEELKLTVYEAIGHIPQVDLMYIAMGCTRLSAFMDSERNEHA